MTEANEQLLAAARAYVTDIFTHRMSVEMVFHNLEHTEDVVEASSRMADYYQLEEEDRLVLLLAAWFHDVGYSAGKAEGHEDVSIEMARQFLESRHLEDSLVQRVTSCIQATRMPQSPITQTEKILCDADLAHLATDDFKARNQLLKQERENLLGQKIPKKNWRKSNAAFLGNHKYFTEYGREMLEPRKQQNLMDVSKSKAEKKEAAEPAPSAFPYMSQQRMQKDEKQERKNTERGVQTMFRTTSKNHLDLSGMADSKAHILITVNSIILSVAVSFLIARLPYYPQFLIPSAILVLTCLIAVTFAILATRPSVSSGKFTEEDIRNKKTNLLFFGNFHKMELQDYQWGMNQMIRDKEYLYNTMIMDIYYLGVVLARKYHFLRISYTIFMYGLILAVIAFAVASLLPEANTAGTDQIPVIDY
ncbi:MAG: Pycsar system effector family protein [Flavisolibacter sp.]